VAQPFTPPPPTVTYLVRINAEEWTEYPTPVNSSKFIADNIAYGHSAEVKFQNAVDLELVRENFNKRISAWLRQSGKNGEFHWEPTDSGARYSLTG
jgi:hypothetical protein